MTLKPKSYFKILGITPFVTVCFALLFIIALIVIDITHSSSIVYSSYITPVVTCVSFVIAFIALGHNYKSTREKNSLEVMAKFNSKQNYEIFIQIYKLRSLNLIDGTSKLDRKKVSPTIEKLSELGKNADQFQLSEGEMQCLEEEISSLNKELLIIKNNELCIVDKSKYITKIKEEIYEKEKKLKKSIQFEEDKRIAVGMIKILNFIEEIACGIRYGVYDEELLFSSFASQIIDIYEISYLFIKKRQIKNERLFINAEWLSVKWTLQREINESMSSINAQKRAVQHANEALKSHAKAPAENKIKKALHRVKKLSYL